MKKALVAVLAAGTVAAAAVAAPAPALARNEGAVAAGVVGGLAVGALLGSAAARSAPPVYAAPVYPAYPAYAPAPGYVVYESYYEPYPVACPGGYWARKPVAFDRHGRPVAWSRPRFMCPGY